ncbi:MAG: hypothetical protein K2F63_01920, partial [Muribaculaceae bacterium]|nr:hypothetical protein [Muribaculaceae bacterium]
LASLYSASEAKDFISNSSTSDDLRLLEKDGRFRVFAAQGASIAAVQEQARSEGLYDRYPNAWICRK